LILLEKNERGNLPLSHDPFPAIEIPLDFFGLRHLAEIRLCHGGSFRRSLCGN
jgi:hypothetical protein